MDVSALQGICLVRELGAFAFVVGALVFVAWEAYTQRRGSGRGQPAARCAGGTAPTVAGVLAGAAAFALGFAHLSEQLKG